MLFVLDCFLLDIHILMNILKNPLKLLVYTYLIQYNYYLYVVYNNNLIEKHTIMICIVVLNMILC